MSRLFRLLVPRDHTHARYSGPPRIHRGEDRNAETLARIARYRLYADCERAPLDWEKRA